MPEPNKLPLPTNPDERESLLSRAREQAVRENTRLCSNDTHWWFEYPGTYVGYDLDVAKSGNDLYAPDTHSETITFSSGRSININQIVVWADGSVVNPYMEWDCESRDLINLSEEEEIELAKIAISKLEEFIRRKTMDSKDNAG